jgi:hypothetical protein
MLILIDSCHKSFKERDMFSNFGAETRATHSSTPKFVSTIENMSRSLNNTYELSSVHVNLLISKGDG